MIADAKRDIDREIKASEMSELKEGLDSARKEVSKAASSIQEASEASEIRSSVESAVKETAPLKEEIRSELDEIDEVAKQMESEITGDAGPDDAPDGTDRQGSGNDPAAGDQADAGVKSSAE